MTVLEAEERLRREIGADESMLWTGVPRGGLVFRPSDLFAIPFTLLWFTLAGRALLVDWKRNGPSLMLIAVSLFGLYVLVGRFFVEAYARSRTAYGLTSRRVLIVAGLSSKSVTSLALDQLPEITMTERPDRSGTLVFGNAPSAFSFGPRSGRALAPPSFDRIPEARNVLERIREAQKGFRK